MTNENVSLKKAIPAFLASKLLSENSKSAYRYDLQHFCAFFETREINKNSILLYRKQLGSLAPSAQKRKISAVNQFLHYLYDAEILSDFYQLTKADPTLQKKKENSLRDFSDFYGPIHSPGQFLACLILETGLTPAEIMTLHWSDFNWRFNALELNQDGKRRVIGLQNKFAVRAKLIKNADELFGKSRQYLYSELKNFTEYSARELREQYVFRQVKEGRSIYELAETLGLKTTTTLEKYFRKENT